MVREAQCFQELFHCIVQGSRSLYSIPVDMDMRYHFAYLSRHDTNAIEEWLHANLAPGTWRHTFQWKGMVSHPDQNIDIFSLHVEFLQEADYHLFGLTWK